VARQAGAIGKDDLRSHYAIVRHVAIGHDEIVVAHFRNAATGARRAIEGAVFADDVAIADLKTCRFAFVTQVLRRFAERDELINAVVAPDARRAVDDDMRSIQVLSPISTPSPITENGPT